jgi:taurine--2-oxoglutarate transaminase
MDAILAACKKAGLIVFNNFNRIHLVPPCTISDEDARRGIALLDEALSIGDAHVRSDDGS